MIRKKAVSSINNKKKYSLFKKTQNIGYIFIAPWLLGFAVLVLWPLAQSFYFSLNSIRLLPAGRLFRFVGLNNFRDVWLMDMFFVQELIGFVLDMIIRVPVIVAFALVIAILLNGKISLRATFRTIYFLPVVIASGPVMTELYEQGATTIPIMNQAAVMGVLNAVFPPWFSDPIGSLFAQIIMILWYSGVQILIFLAALQKVDVSLYEAATIDGGSGWECFWKVTLPTSKPMILLNAVYTLISLANSDQNIIINLIYINMFSAVRGYGFASAMAWMYAVIMSAILAVIVLAFKERSSYGKRKQEVYKTRKASEIFKIS